MGIILALLTLALIFAGAGFVVHVLWAVGALLFVLWFAGILSDVANRSRSTRSQY
jgi:amino acid permease